MYFYLFFFFFPCDYSVCLRRKKKRNKEKTKSTHNLGVTEKPAGVQSIEEIAQNHLCGNIVLMKG